MYVLLWFQSEISPVSKMGEEPELLHKYEITVKWDDWKRFAVPLEPPAGLLGAQAPVLKHSSSTLYLSLSICVP